MQKSKLTVKVNAPKVTLREALLTGGEALVQMAKADVGDGSVSLSDILGDLDVAPTFLLAMGRLLRRESRTLLP